MKEIKNWNFQILANRLYLQFRHSSIFILILMHLRRTNFKFFSSHQSSLLVDFSDHVWRQQISIFPLNMLSWFLPVKKSNFQNFKRLNNNEGGKLVLSHNLLNFKGELIWSLTLDNENEVITGRRAELIEYLKGIKILWWLQSSYMLWVIIETTICGFMQTRRLPMSPCFQFLSHCGISLPGMVCI